MRKDLFQTFILDAYAVAVEAMIIEQTGEDNKQLIMNYYEQGQGGKSSQN
jgi:hypothetical protein